MLEPLIWLLVPMLIPWLQHHWFGFLCLSPFAHTKWIHSESISTTLCYRTPQCRTQWIAKGSVFGVVSVCFVCVWNISGTAEQICAKFTRWHYCWSLPWTSLKVKVTRDKLEAKDVSPNINRTQTAERTENANAVIRSWWPWPSNSFERGTKVQTASTSSFWI